MQVTVYSFRPLKDELRSTFELPAWPYSDEPEFRKMVIKYLKDNLIFYYTDNETTDGGKDISRPIFNQFDTATLGFPFNAYMSTCFIGNDSFKIIQWPLDRAEGTPLLNKLKNDPVGKDLMAWSSWNVPVEIESVNGFSIKRQILHQYVNDLDSNNKCTKPNPNARNHRRGYRGK